MKKVTIYGTCAHNMQAYCVYITFPPTHTHSPTHTRSTGSIILRDPSSNQVLVSFLIRYVLFCARGQADSGLNDCIAINVLHKKSGVYHCHVFKCELPETVSDEKSAKIDLFFYFLCKACYNDVIMM